MIIKHPRLIIKQHGTIKNYRYVGDVSQRRVFLQQEFFGCHQDNTSVDDYCRHLKTLDDELRDIGAKIDDDLLLSTLTAGHNEDFDNAAANLSLIPNPSFAKAIAPVLSQKIFIRPDAPGITPRSDMNSFI